MRVLTFLHSFEPGGVERIALRLVRRWREQGIDAPLFMGRMDGAMAADVGADLPVIVPPRRWPGVAHWETLWMMLTLPRVIRSQRPDVLFSAGNTYAVICVFLKLWMRSDCPPIVAKVSNDLDRLDAPWLQRLFYRRWLRLQSRFIDHFVGMEEPMRDEIIEGMNIASSRISIIPDPALSDPLIARLRRHDRTDRVPNLHRHFVTVGRLVPQKNIALMLRAFANGSAPNDRLTIFGDGGARAKLPALAARLGIAGRVEFRGYVAEPAAMLPTFDALLLSSDYEGVPAVILEALAANIAIVATNCSRSMPALLMGGKLGALVEVGNVSDLALAISAVRPGSQNRELSLSQAKRFTIEHAGDAYLEAMTVLTGLKAIVQDSRPVQRNIADVAVSR